MDWISAITFDQILLSALTLCVLRQALIFILPDDVAGPGGWLVNTEYSDKNA